MTDPSPSQPRRSPLSSKPVDHDSSLDDQAVKRRFPIQRKRLGKIMTIREQSQFGFIDGEDFREDVFFHFDVWQGSIERKGKQLYLKPEESMWVEFEIDEEHLAEQDKLRAKVVRPTDRPGGRKLSGRDATFNIMTRHPKARKKKPSWRK